MCNKVDLIGICAICSEMNDSFKIKTEKMPSFNTFWLLVPAVLMANCSSDTSCVRPPCLACLLFACSAFSLSSIHQTGAPATPAAGRICSNKGKGCRVSLSFVRAKATSTQHAHDTPHAVQTMHPTTTPLPCLAQSQRRCMEGHVPSELARLLSPEIFRAHSQRVRDV